MSIFSLFTTSDGNIPFTPIVFSIILGILGTLLYQKFYIPYMESLCKATPHQKASRVNEVNKVNEEEKFVPVLVDIDELPEIPPEAVEEVSENVNEEDKKYYIKGQDNGTSD